MEPDPFLQVRALGKHFASGRWALREVSFHLARRRTLALVGPSGAGKSTLAHCLAGLEIPDEGTARIEGREIRSADVQLIPQQPASSFNPRFSAAEAVVEPLVIQRCVRRSDVISVAAVAMKRVGLPVEAATRRVGDFSGGEHQRLAIARALALEPKLLVLDESLSALDDSSLERTVELLRDLQRTLSLTYILIAHDLTVAGRLADEIAVMEAGRIVEHRPATELMASPRHPVTLELVTAHRLLNTAGCDL
jgi:peptide/nickel transport system ATP-binding protein